MKKKPDFIFVGGMPRSGTSLVGQLTDKADGVFNPGTDNNVINILHKAKNTGFQLKRVNIPEILDHLFRTTNIKNFGILASDVLDELEGQDVRDWYDLSIHFFIALKKKKKCTIYLKSPGLEHYFFVINQRLPMDFDRKFIYVVRNPLDAYLSNKYSGLAWTGKQPKTTDNSIQWALSWLQSVNLFYFNKDALEGNIFLLQHEKVVATREVVFSKLFDYLGLDLNEEVLNHNNHRQSSISGQKGVNRVFSEVERENIVNLCFDQMQNFGYLSNSQRPVKYTDSRKGGINFYSNFELLKRVVKNLLNK